jgi:hypothetical protein
VRLKHAYPEEELCALPDIELVWKAHLIRPLPYKKVGRPPLVTYNGWVRELTNQGGRIWKLSLESWWSMMSVTASRLRC